MRLAAESRRISGSSKRGARWPVSMTARRTRAHVLAERGLRELRARLELEVAADFGERRAVEALDVDLERVRAWWARRAARRRRRWRASASGRGAGRTRPRRGRSRGRAGKPGWRRRSRAARRRRGACPAPAASTRERSSSSPTPAPGRGRDGELDARDRHLRANDEAERDPWAPVGACAGGVACLDARVGDAPRVEERLQRLAHEHGREGRTGRDAQARAQLGERCLLDRRLLNFECDALDCPPLVAAQVGREARGAVAGARDRRREQQHEG